MVPRKRKRGAPAPGGGESSEMTDLGEPRYLTPVPPGSVVRPRPADRVIAMDLGEPLSAAAAKARRAELGIPDADRPLLPTAREVAVAKLPRWAEVALAARCARRVWPLIFRGWNNDSFLIAVRRAVESAERAAAEARFDAKELETLQQGAADTADASPPDAGAHAASVVCHALDAVEGASAIRSESPNVIYPAADAVQVGGFALLAAAAVESPVRRWLLCLRRDFDRILHLARKHAWTDDTPVPPDVFGPLWPKDLTPAWATEPAPPTP